MRLLLVALLLAGCGQTQQTEYRGTTPPSLGLAPPWMYSKPRPRLRYPSPPTVRKEPVEKPVTVIRVPEESSDVEDRIDDIQSRIDELRRGLKR